MGQTNLYVFVDESGNHSQGPNFTLAGTWCFSKCNRAGRVLVQTKDRALDLIDRAGAPELKGSQLSTQELDQLVSCFDHFACSDDTVCHREEWIGGPAIGATIHTVDPSAAREVIEATTGERLSAPELIQSMSLLQVLNPVFSLRHRSGSPLGKIEVVLDSKTWDRPISRVSPHFQSVAGTTSGVKFNTADSKETPGIQLSDLIAYSWHQRQTQDECADAIDSINNLLLPR